jgi:hypothetical protein
MDSRNQHARELAASLVVEYLIQLGATKTAELLDSKLDVDDVSLLERVRTKHHVPEDRPALPVLVYDAVSHKKQAGRPLHKAEATNVLTHAPHSNNAALPPLPAMISSSPPVPGSLAANAEQHTSVPSLQTEHGPAVTADVYAVADNDVEDDGEGQPAERGEQAQAQEAPWAEAELELLQQGLKQYRANLEANQRYKLIAALVGTRTKRQCRDKAREIVRSEALRKRAGAN